MYIAAASAPAVAADAGAARTPGAIALGGVTDDKGMGKDVPAAADSLGSNF